MKKIKRVSHDVYVLLFKSSYTPIQRLRLLVNYLKILVLNFLNGRILSIKEVSFLGHRWSVSDVGVFYWLVSEVFVHEPYLYYGDMPPRKIIDGGSNIGVSILYFKFKYPESNIVGFEPDPQVCSELRFNIEKNKIDFVQVHAVALSDVESEISFYKRKDISIASSSFNVDPKLVDEIKVKAMPLSSFLSTDFDLAKLDLQFSEAIVFSELAKSGSISKIKNFIMEYHYRFDVKNNNLSLILDAFEKNEFDYTIKFNASKPNRFRTYQIVATNEK